MTLQSGGADESATQPGGWPTGPTEENPRAHRLRYAVTILGHVLRSETPPCLTGVLATRPESLRSTRCTRVSD